MMWNYDQTQKPSVSRYILSQAFLDFNTGDETNQVSVIRRTVDVHDVYITNYNQNVNMSTEGIYTFELRGVVARPPMPTTPTRSTSVPPPTTKLLTTLQPITTTPTTTMMPTTTMIPTTTAMPTTIPETTTGECGITQDIFGDM